MDRVQGARELRRLRESRGWSWAELAQALRTSARDLSITAITECQLASLQRNVARWESGRGCPSDRYQVLLARLYRADLLPLLTALAHFGVAEHRLSELTELVAVAKGSHAPMGTPVDELLAVVRRVNAGVGSAPFVRLQLELAPVVEQVRRLRHKPPADLLPVATAAFSLAARIAFETHDDGAAALLYGEATSAAGELPDRRYRAAVRTSHSMVALHSGQIDLARNIALAAVRDAHAGSSGAVRARAHAVHAEISACRGEKRTARTAFERAWKTVDQLPPDDPAFDARRLDGFQALYELHVGEASRAHDRLMRSVAGLKCPRDVVQRGINIADLALAHLRLGDPAAGAALLHDAVDITARTGGRVPGQRVRQVRRELRPWRAEPFVADLDDHIHDTLIGR